jgi:2-C-methyl-D-erythritol 4-phosphate cytidylyltransferase
MRAERPNREGIVPVASDPVGARTPSVPHRTTWAIVLAAGRGERFGAQKQFAVAGGQRLVDHAVDVAVRSCEHVILVLPDERRWDGPEVARVVVGGRDRPASVRRGLEAIPADEGIVAVHQAASPLASRETFAAVLDAVAGGASGAFPGLRPADLVRRREAGRALEVVGRDDLVLVQSPTAFRLGVLRAAHASGRTALEDTALVSACGYELHVVDGDPRNLHVATRRDLEMVQTLASAGGR